MNEYRVVWKRDGLQPKRKRYARRAMAERFMALLGPEPWTALGKNPDELFCCSGSECACRGMSVREHSDATRAELPALEYVRLEERAIGTWARIAALEPTA